MTHKIRRARWIWNDHWWYQLSGLVHPLRKVTLAFLEIFFLEFWALVFQWFKTWMSWANAKHRFASNDNIQKPNYWMNSLTPFLCLQDICISSVLLFVLSCLFNEVIFCKILRAKYYIVNMLESCMIFNNSFFTLGLHPVIYLANRWTFFWWSLWMPWKTAALTLVLNTSMLISFSLWCSENGSFFAIKCFILWWNICRTQSWIPLLRIIIFKSL